MTTLHRPHFCDSRKLTVIDSESIDLVVTSPPYPMIDMWDDLFCGQNAAIAAALNETDPNRAFELMHRELDLVWKQVFRALKPGGLACINIGDAVRTIDGQFALYPNHARVLSGLVRTGFTALPAILWRKQTNAPNKFMGSGMLPPGAYTTLEHEYILILRKGSRRTFTTDDQTRTRRASAFFWEERNQWFSDLWTDLKGTPQGLDAPNTRSRSAAFPFELPFRLINMFSVKGDTILDPFAGTGTTMYAAMAAERNSIMVDKDTLFAEPMLSRLGTIIAAANARNVSRLDNHLRFIAEREQVRGPLKHKNSFYGFPVVTRQETEIVFSQLTALQPEADGILAVEYKQMVF
ncbi:MAG: site-specific DNA-methyltransferase [Desulfobacterales bacterium]|nr:site-specific DNA-methyltransferase [Desulfobacterales bacterium]